MPYAAKNPWFLCACLKVAWVQCLSLFEKAYRLPYRQLTGHLTDSLTGALAAHELVGTNLW